MQINSCHVLIHFLPVFSAIFLTPHTDAVPYLPFLGLWCAFISNFSLSYIFPFPSVSVCSSLLSHYILLLSHLPPPSLSLICIYFLFPALIFPSFLMASSGDVVFLLLCLLNVLLAPSVWKMNHIQWCLMAGGNPLTDKAIFADENIDAEVVDLLATITKQFDLFQSQNSFCHDSLIS